MTKQEFEAIAGKKVTDEQYKEIEFVYSFHPCISETDGKQQIATIFNIGGMRLIRDMNTTANQAQNLEDEERMLRTQLERVKDQMKELRHPTY